MPTGAPNSTGCRGRFWSCSAARAAACSWLECECHGAPPRSHVGISRESRPTATKMAATTPHAAIDRTVGTRRAGRSDFSSCSSVVSDGASASERISCDSGKFWTMAAGAAAAAAPAAAAAAAPAAATAQLFTPRRRSHLDARRPPRRDRRRRASPACAPRDPPFRMVKVAVIGGGIALASRALAACSSSARSGRLRHGQARARRPLQLAAVGRPRRGPRGAIFDGNTPAFTEFLRELESEKIVRKWPAGRVGRLAADGR